MRNLQSQSGGLWLGFPGAEQMRNPSHLEGANIKASYCFRSPLRHVFAIYDRFLRKSLIVVVGARLYTKYMWVAPSRWHHDPFLRNNSNDCENILDNLDNRKFEWTWTLSISRNNVQHHHFMKLVLIIPTSKPASPYSTPQRYSSTSLVYPQTSSQQPSHSHPPPGSSPPSTPAPTPPQPAAPCPAPKSPI